MADDVEAFGVLSVTIATVASRSMHMRRVDDLAVDLAGERGLGEAGADRRGDFGNGDRRVEMLDGAVGQSDVGHGFVRTNSGDGEWCLIRMKSKKCGGAALFSWTDEGRPRERHRVVITPVLHAFAVS